jgi:hypothetical protein
MHFVGFGVANWCYEMSAIIVFQLSVAMTMLFVNRPLCILFTVLYLLHNMTAYLSGPCWQALFCVMNS